MDHPTQTLSRRCIDSLHEPFPQGRAGRLCGTIIAFQGITKDYHRRQWESLSRKKGEDILELERRVTAILDNWTADATTKAEMRDHFATEKLLTLTSSNIISWTRNQEPRTSREAAQISSRYEASQIPEPAPKSHTPRSDGYKPYRFKPRNNPEESPQEKSKPYPSLSDKPVKQDDRRTWDKEKGPRCFGCQKFGHTAAHCPDKTPEKAPEKTANLGEVAEKENFPMYSGSVNGRRVTRLLRDTGANHSQVHARLVGKHFRNEGWLTVKGVHTSKPLPTTTVTLKINGLKTKVRMLVNENLDFDVLMWNDIPHIDSVTNHEQRRRQ